MPGSKDIEKNSSTEEKIKEAAKKVFTQRGYAAARTRDIAEESGFNLALINYYFRSKENLFDIIITEQLQIFIHSVMDIVNDPIMSLKEKVELLIAHYIDMLVENPYIPVFVLSEINADPHKLMAKIGFEKVDRNNMLLARQWKELAAARRLTIDPRHFVINVLSLTIFPFVASPLIRDRMKLSIEEFNALMQERKKLIPMWVRGMLIGGSEGTAEIDIIKK